MIATASEYLTVTEEQNALDYLEKAVAFIRSAKARSIEWKWVILATHAALYGFMICALKGTNPDNVCTNKSGKSKLIDFPTAFAWCQDDDDSRKCISGFTQPLKVTEVERQAVERVHSEFRNEFEHYQPKLWSIELAGLPEIIGHVLDVVRMVSLEMGCYFVHYRPGDSDRIAALIRQGKDVLQSYVTFGSDD